LRKARQDGLWEQHTSSERNRKENARSRFGKRRKSASKIGFMNERYVLTGKEVGNLDEGSLTGRGKRGKRKNI